MASKVLVSIPGVPFSQIQVKKSHSGELVTNSLVLGSQDYAFRVAHLEHSIKFLQEQHQLMLSGLHKEIEALRERNRDLQFQLIFNKDSSPKPGLTSSEDNSENSAKEVRVAEAARLSREAAAARGEARAAEARALQLQQLLDAQTEKLRALELQPCPACGAGSDGAGAGARGAQGESPAELRARLADAERLVRRLRTDADRQRRELQCMKNSLTASLRVTGLDVGGFSNHGYRPHNYHFPPLPQPEFWPEPHRDEYQMMNGHGRNRRPVTLPELQTNGHHIHPSTVYANHHTRQRPNGYEHQQRSNDRKKGSNHPVIAEAAKSRSSDGQNEQSTSQQADYSVNNSTNSNGSRSRGKRNNHRKAASTDHT